MGKVLLLPHRISIYTYLAPKVLICPVSKIIVHLLSANRANPAIRHMVRTDWIEVAIDAVNRRSQDKARFHFVVVMCFV